MALQSKIEALYNLTYELLNLGMDGSPIYSTHFCKLNTDVYRQSEDLFPLHGGDDTQEAYLCFALLTGYHATIYDHGDKNRKVQAVLDRSWKVLDRLPASLLKCQLLVACFSEVLDEELAKQAHEIINGWEGRELSEAEVEVMEYLECLEANPWPSWEEEKSDL